MFVQHRIDIAASCETIFRFCADVEAWSTWDPDTREAWIDGPLEAGRRGTLTPTRGRKVPLQITDVVPGRSFVAESRLPLFRMRFAHQLSPTSSGTQVTHRVDFLGPLSLLLGPVLARRLNEGLPVTLARLKSLAEARQAT